MATVRETKMQLKIKFSVRHHAMVLTGLLPSWGSGLPDNLKFGVLVKMIQFWRLY